jgi:HlyD family secretion protein
MSTLQKKALLAGALTVLLLGSAAAMWFERDPALEGQFARVKKASFDVRVETVGVLDAGRSFQIASSLRGDKGKIVQIAEDGAKVTAGTMLVRFDATPFEADIQKLTGELKSREAVADSAAQALQVEKSQADKDISAAEFDVKAAKQEYSRYQDYISDLEKLADKGYAVENEVSQAKSKAEQVFAKLQKAESDLARQQKEAVFKIAQAMAELNKAKSEAATTGTALAEAQAGLAQTQIRSPIDGFVVQHEIFVGNQKRKPRAGDTVWQGQPILYLPDLSSMVVKSQVREEDLHKIRPGQEATIRVDAYPDALFKGKLASVGVLAVENASDNSAGKHFLYNVTMLGNDARLRPGMTARIALVTDHVNKALTVPLAALFADNGRRYCYVVQGKSLERRYVSIGRANDDVAEITLGLSEGQQVSLIKP